METITDHRSLINALGGNVAVANSLGDCTAGRVSQWKLGNRIPVEYWPGIIALAETCKVPGITSDWLMNNMRARVNSGGADSEAAAAQ